VFRRCYGFQYRGISTCFRSAAAGCCTGTWWARGNTASYDGTDRPGRARAARPRGEFAGACHAGAATSTCHTPTGTCGAAAGCSASASGNTITNGNSCGTDGTGRTGAAR
jgi:hypothetical protein